LVEDFEEQLITKTNKRKSPSKSNKQSPSKKSNNTNAQESDEDYQSDENQSIVTEDDTDFPKNDDEDEDDSRIATRQSPRKKASLSTPTSDDPSPSTRRHSNRKIVKQTKSRITSMCKCKSNL
jgi:hypothetical protein